MVHCHAPIIPFLTKILLFAGFLQLFAGSCNSQVPGLIVPLAKSEPAMMADPEELLWLSAARIPDLSLSLLPDSPSLEALPTEVFVFWRPEALYVRFVSRTPALHVPHGKTRDANHYEGDVVEVFLDPVGDARQMIELQVNPQGGVLDVMFLATDEPQSGEDGVLTPEFLSRNWWNFRSWDWKNLRVANTTSPSKEGGVLWVCDIAIPATELLRRLGETTLSPRRLRANFLRYDGPLDAETGKRSHDIFMNWAPVRYGCPHISPQAMGVLVLAP